MGLFKKKVDVVESENDKEVKPKKAGREVVEAVVIALILALVLRAFLVQAFKIPSGSMEDTLLVGDHLLVNKASYGIQLPRPAWLKVFGVTIPFFETTLKPVWGKIERGDVIVFKYPWDRNKDFIKRVVGVGGDRVEVRDAVTYVNGKKFDNPYEVFKDGGWGGIRNYGPYIVPEDHLFVMGDNRDRSSDSRKWGPVHISDVRGKAFMIYFSWNREEGNIRFDRIIDRIK